MTAQDLINQTMNNLREAMDLAPKAFWVFASSSEFRYETVEFKLYLVPGKASYTIGPDGDLKDANRSRVLRSCECRYREFGFPQIVIPDHAIPVDNLRGLPGQVSYSERYPLSELRFFPAPNQPFTARLVFGVEVLPVAHSPLFEAYTREADRLRGVLAKLR